MEIKSWEFGKGSFDKEDTYETDAIVIINYFEGEEEIPNLTIENCADLAAMLSNKADIDDSYTSFANTYKGQIIEFDGRVDYITNHGSYDTRYDILVSAGDYDPDHMIGPAFKFEDVGAYNLGMSSLDNVESEIWVGRNVHIIARVEKFNSNSGLFFLDPISVVGR